MDEIKSFDEFLESLSTEDIEYEPVEEIVKKFQFEGEFIKAEPHGKGHINETYAVYFENGPYERYILQEINTFVFKEPEHLMKNMFLVTEHIKDKILEDGGNPERKCLQIIQTKDNQLFYKNNNNRYWRAFTFIEDAKTYQVVTESKHLEEAGYAFGNFHKQLADFPVEKLYEVIPDFHYTPKRFLDFRRAVNRDIIARRETCETEIHELYTRRDYAYILTDPAEQRALTEQIIHNDTKFNNVMIDNKTGKAICVIDLDTVMPGLILYDFGDAIRTGASTAEEDEVDIEKVSVDLDLFEAFTKGFLVSSKETITKLEIELLAESALVLTYETALRFLGDYVADDVYFDTEYEDHNLVRAKNQIALLKSMEENLEKMQNIVLNCAEREGIRGKENRNSYSRFWV